MTLVIMAAGMGSRFGGLKQIEPIGPSGEFILDYSVYDAIRAGFSKVVFIIKEENLELFKSTVGNRIEEKIKVEYVFQKLTDVPSNVVIPESRVKPWGTSHAILTAKKAVNEKFVVINADDFYGKDAYLKAKEFLDSSLDDSKEHLCMVSYLAENTLTENGEVARGICNTNEEGYLTSLVETKVIKKGDIIEATPAIGGETFNISKDNVVSMNFWGFTPKVFEFLEEKLDNFFEINKDNLDKAEYFISTSVFDMIKEEKADVKVLKTEAKWFGITYKDDKEKLVNEIKHMIITGEYPSNLWD